MTCCFIAEFQFASFLKYASFILLSSCLMQWNNYYCIKRYKNNGGLIWYIYTSYCALVFFVLFDSSSFYLVTCLWRLKWTTKMRAESTAICFLYVFLLIRWSSFCSRNEDKFLSSEIALQRRLFAKRCYSEARYMWCCSDVTVAGGNPPMNRCAICVLPVTRVWIVGSLGQAYINLIDLHDGAI